MIYGRDGRGKEGREGVVFGEIQGRGRHRLAGGALWKRERAGSVPESESSAVVPIFCLLALA